MLGDIRIYGGSAEQSIPRLAGEVSFLESNLSWLSQHNGCLFQQSACTEEACFDMVVDY